MSTTPMHSEAHSATCAWCPAVFTPRRRWQRFCGPACRTDYHRWAKPHTVRELRDLVRLALDGCDPLGWNPRARKVLGIKPPPPVHSLAASVAETIEKVNRDADRRDAEMPTP